MNEYTRREEARWTFVASSVLVACLGVAVPVVLTARGPLVPSKAVAMQRDAAQKRATVAHGCQLAVERVEKEVPIFLTSVKAAHLDAPAPPPRPRGPNARKEPELDASVAWSSAQNLYKPAKTAAPCRELIESEIGARPDAAKAWSAIVAAAAIPAPGESDKTAQVAASQRLRDLFSDTAVTPVVEEAQRAQTLLKAKADMLARAAETTFVRDELPKGLMAREIALALGIFVSLAALLVSYVSLRAASLRRMATLIPLRQVARTPQRGLQAAAILSLAAQHNGGEPGIVVGAAVGGLVAAIAFRTDGDLFVAGVMGGLVVGLGVQWLLRIAAGSSRWRSRATELAELEKPATPIVLVLSGVNVGLEAQFLEFFEQLAPVDAAATVDQLAARAEERILAAAEAGAAPYAGAMGAQHSGGFQ